MRVDCCGYTLEDGIDNLEIPCPNEGKGEFKKKPGFFRCKKCWKLMIEYEKQLYKEGKLIKICDKNGHTPEYLNHLNFISFNCSFWNPGPNGYNIAFNSKGEPFELKYLDWYYKVYYPDKYEERLKNRRLKKQSIINEYKEKKDKVKRFKENIKTKEALNRLFKRK